MSGNNNSAYLTQQQARVSQLDALSQNLAEARAQGAEIEMRPRAQERAHNLQESIIKAQQRVELLQQALQVQWRQIETQNQSRQIVQWQEVEAIQRALQQATQQSEKLQKFQQVILQRQGLIGVNMLAQQRTLLVKWGIRENEQNVIRNLNSEFLQTASLEATSIGKRSAASIPNAKRCKM